MSKPMSINNREGTAKNILYVHYGDNWIRGSEVCLINLVNSLNRKQFKPVIWTNNSSLYSHLSTSELCLLSSFNFLANELTPEANLNDWIKQIAKAIKTIRENKIDLIHVNSGAPCQWMVIASYITKVPLVTHLHSDYNWLDRITFGLHLAPVLVTVSHAISFNLRQEGVCNTNLKVISNGCPTPNASNQKPFDLKEKYQLDDKDTLLISVGSLIHRKGMDKLIKVIYALKNEPHRYHLIIVGEGEKRAELESLCQQLNVADRVHLVGEQPEPYRWLMGGADIFISGARSEAFGLVLAEAALAGLPVVAPNLDGIPEVLIDKHSALLYEDDSISSIVELVLKISNNKELQNNLAAAAKYRVENKFSIKANTHSFEKLYLEILANPSSGLPQIKTLFYPFSYALFTGLISRLGNKIRNLLFRFSIN